MVQDVKKFGRRSLLRRSEWLDEINYGRGLGRGLAEKRGERLHLVACLHLLHMIKVTGVEKLRAITGERQFGLRAKHLVDTLGRFTFPTRTGEQKRPASIAGRAGADVVEVLRVVVDELDAEIAVLFHCWHGEH